MNKENKPIEDLFKDAFENFEKVPSSNVWSGIQAGINAPVAGTAAAAKGTMSIGAKIGIAVATVGVIATTLYVGFINTGEEKATINQQKVVTEQENILTPIVEEENISAETITEKTENKESNPIVITNKNEEKSVIEISDKKGKTTDDRINQSSSKVDDNSTPKDITTENTSESTENNVSASENNEITDKQEISNNKATEPFQKEEKPKEEVAPLTATINVNQASGEVPFLLTFSTPEVADKYTWKLNGLTISNSQSSSIEVSATGTQKLELTVTKGKETLQSIQIIDAKKSASVSIPNIFTPNQDGVNDVFRIEEGFNQLSVRILDQNYKELHSWVGEYGFWDGTYPDGSMAPNGVYFYIGTYKENGKEKTVKGSVTLRR